MGWAVKSHACSLVVQWCQCRGVRRLSGAKRIIGVATFYLPASERQVKKGVDRSSRLPFNCAVKTKVNRTKKEGLDKLGT